MDQIDSLYEWDFEVANLAQMRERLRRRPEYPAAARRLAANMLRDAEADPALDGLRKDAGRTVAGLSAAYLNASGGLTLARLKDFIAGFGLVSPGRARALLIYMRYLGYVEPNPGRGQRPAASYRLTPRFLATYTRHQASLLDALQVIEPGAGLVLRNLHAPSVFNTLVIEQGDAFTSGSPQAEPFEDWYGVFMNRHAGIQVLHALVAQADCFPPEGPIALSLAAMARRLKVSRVHLTRMVKAAERHDFVELEPGGLRFTEAGRQALDWLYASRFCVLLACAARTLKANEEVCARTAA
ncbi:hypothetical protein [Phenylobacterium montanum]|uniref:Uncharacterized protein n=1 Tax=Phenylobacterium montanum TaxID=2823693 RepID=A0A975FX53_9CAUL|nr:hypothetical protein [Caulobacter sp. S6]QUD86589.1 hypothetical protein KCG34_16050 [Caulobacter sp. S6]